MRGSDPVQPDPDREWHGVASNAEVEQEAAPELDPAKRKGVLGRPAVVDEQRGIGHRQGVGDGILGTREPSDQLGSVDGVPSSRHPGRHAGDGLLISTEI